MKRTYLQSIDHCRWRDTQAARLQVNLFLPLPHPLLIHLCSSVSSYPYQTTDSLYCAHQARTVKQPGQFLFDCVNMWCLPWRAYRARSIPFLAPPSDRPTPTTFLRIFPNCTHWYWQFHLSVTNISRGSRHWCIHNDLDAFATRSRASCLKDHIFTLCPHFTIPLRTSWGSDLHSHITRLLLTSSISPAAQSFILNRVICVQSIFLDSDGVWPAQRSFCYFGVLPPLFQVSLTLHQPQLHTRVAQKCHTSSI